MASGEILIDHGVISRDVLHKFIRVQIEEAVYFLFTWTQGTFSFDADIMPGVVGGTCDERRSDWLRHVARCAGEARDHPCLGKTRLESPARDWRPRVRRLRTSADR